MGLKQWLAGKASAPSMQVDRSAYENAVRAFQALQEAALKGQVSQRGRANRGGSYLACGYGYANDVLLVSK